MENKTKKTKFNVIDIVVIVLILLAVGFSIWFFFLRPSQTESSKPVNVTYTIELKQIDETYLSYFKKDDDVKNPVDFKSLGIITNVSYANSTYVSSEYDENKVLKTNKYDTLYDITLTIQTIANLNSLNIPVLDNQKLLVGNEISLIDSSYITHGTISSVVYN